MVLEKAKGGSVPENEMPTMILVLSDMEFNGATGGSNWGGRESSWNPTAQTMIEKMYSDAGYKVPKLVYWNIQSRNDF